MPEVHPFRREDRRRRNWSLPNGGASRWSIADAASSLVAADALALGFYGVVRSVGSRPTESMSALLSEIALVVVLFGVAKWRGPTTVRSFGLVAPRDRAEALVVTARWLLFLVVVTALYASFVDVNDTARGIDTGLAGEHSDRALLLVTAVIGAPLTEEVFYRGFIYRALRNRLRPLLATVVAGLLFGGDHILGAGLSAVPPIAAFGMVTCLLYERTGSIFPGLALHVLFDSNAALNAVFGWTILVPFLAAAAVVTLFAGAHRALACARNSDGL